jgi:hypothetical protein
MGEFAVIDGVAAGAMLAMIARTMVPRCASSQSVRGRNGDRSGLFSCDLAPPISALQSADTWQGDDRG